MTERLSAEQEALFRAPVHAVLTTINPDGQPQSSVVWTKVEDGQVVFSTIRGRRKTRNMERDPRVTLLAYDPADPGSYIEVRGAVTLDEAGGPELIDELSRAYDDEPWDPEGDGTRVVARVGAERIVVR